jgi:hypothetical protein
MESANNKSRHNHAVTQGRIFTKGLFDFLMF